MTALLSKKMDLLRELNRKVLSEKTIEKKLSIVSNERECQHFLEQNLPLKESLKELNLDAQFLVKSVLSIGEGPSVFKNCTRDILKSDAFIQLLDILKDIERYYDSIGGIIGYHLTVLECLQNKQEKVLDDAVQYLHPAGIDLRKDTLELREAIQFGISSLSNMAEIYVVGGAGDRLNLQDEKTKQAQPAAELMFCGKTLLEGLFRDLQAREYLHFKLYKKQVLTPVAMMTSHEKNNHHHILTICEKNKWFGRPEKSLLFFTQPLVPVITENGDWAIASSLRPMLKPGGHGVIWKQALDSGIIDYFIDEKRPLALIRQINNPVAGIDYGLIAFVGWGAKHKKWFGFASCPRLLNASEGMDILKKKKVEKGVEYCLTNVEYTVFDNHGLKDEPEQPNSPFSRYPANTNILFADLSALKTFINKNPIPGMIINMKNTISHINKEGKKEEVFAGRLESTMQNIADEIVEQFSEPLNEISPNSLKTFITYNERKKTISVTKKSYVNGEKLLETPEGCFFELLQNYQELLENFCCIKTPLLESNQSYIEEGPSFTLLYHPALGPLFEIIGQKIQNGILEKGSHLELEITELEIENIHLKGSLIIHATHVLGKENSHGIIEYGENNGKCVLKNVVIENKGIDRTKNNQYWKNVVHHQEKLTIILHGNGEFLAENVTFSGNHTFEVPEGHRMTVYLKGNEILTKLEKISSPSWYWSYEYDKDRRIKLNKSTRSKG